MNLLIDLHIKHKKTIVLVTHDINLVKHAHRVIHLKDGKVIKDVVRKTTHHNDGK